MTHGFIIMLASGSFPGSMCFVYNVGSVRYGEKAWGRHTEREMAYVFGSEAEAHDALCAMAREIKYQAPELNNNLAARLGKAKIVPA